MSGECFVERECAVGGIGCRAWAEWFQACEEADPKALDQDRDPLALISWPFNYQACERPDVCPLAFHHIANAGKRRGLSGWPPASLGLPGVEGKELKTRDPGEVADRAIPLLREILTIGGDRLSKRNQSLWVDLLQDTLTFFDWLEHPDREPGSKEDLEAAIAQALELIAGNCEESEILRAALERARAAKG